MTDHIEQDLAQDIARGVSRAFTQINELYGCSITLTELAESRIYGDWLPEIRSHIGQGGAVEQYLFAKLQTERRRLAQNAGPQWLRTVLLPGQGPAAQSELLIPYSVHPSITSKKIDYNEQKPAREIVRWLRDWSYRRLTLKRSAKLFAPVLSTGGHNKIDVASDSGMIPIDADGGPSFDEVAERLRRLQAHAVMYTSAHHRLQGTERFRVIIFLSELVGVHVYRQTHRAICRLISGRTDWYSDTSKSHPYSLFYLPADYAVTRGQNRFEVIDGDIYSPEFWCLRSPEPERPKPARSAMPQPSIRRTIPLSVELEEWSAQSFATAREDCAEQYLRMGSGRYNGLFSICVKTAGAAVWYGYDLSVTELSDFAGQLYQANPPSKAKRTNFDQMAADAIASASGGNQHPKLTQRRSWQDGRGVQSFEELLQP